MKHRKISRRLGRQNSHRKATLKNMASAVLARESITTTSVKAKVAQSFVDKIITIAKTNTPESKRHVFALIRDKEIIETLFNEIGPRFKDRHGGYTRVTPLYPRKGDGSAMAVLELVEKKPKTEEAKPKKGPGKAKPEDEKPRVKKEQPPGQEEGKHERPAPPPKKEPKKHEREKKEKAEREKKKGILGNFKRYFRKKPE